MSRKGKEALLTKFYIERKVCVSELPSDHCFEFVLLPKQECRLQQGNKLFSQSCGVVSSSFRGCVFEFLPLMSTFFFSDLSVWIKSGHRTKIILLSGKHFLPSCLCTLAMLLKPCPFTSSLMFIPSTPPWTWFV